MRIDLHVHSKFSTRPSQWLLQKLGCPESFTEPERLYEIARGRGMDMVTISDHNTIEGALSIAHLPGVFISEEITSYFPADGCKVHVLALNIDEVIHADIQKVRENVFELVPYLRQKGVPHICAHPLFGVNDRLTVEHFEQMLLLFSHFEANGTRDGFQNDTLAMVLASLTPEIIERLAEKHGLEPGFERPWIKHMTGGSDDHSALNIASIHTEVKGATDLPGFLAGLAEGRCGPRGHDSSPRAMAHNLYSIAYQFYRSRFGFDRYVNKDVFLKFADRFLSPDTATRSGSVVDRLQAYFTTRRYQRGTSPTGPVQDVVRFEAAKLVLEDPALLAIARGGELPDKPEEEWFRFLTRASNKVLTVFADNLLGHASGANIFDVFQTIGSAGALYTVSAAFFVSYGLFRKDRAFCEQIRKRFGTQNETRADDVRVGHFTDTFFEVNGVARTLQRTVNLARATGKDMTIITCTPGGEHADTPGVRNFEPVGVFDLPEYPDLKIFYPPVLEMLDCAYEQGLTHLHSSTPGPIGLAALMVARILKLPISGTYHTQIPQYVGKLTGDTGLEDLTWRYILWYYGQMDTVYAPSRATAEELIAHGLPAEKIRVYPRGVDTSLYHPVKRNGFLKRYAIRGGVTLLYVGRISKEKNLELLAEAYRELIREHPEANLVLAGDGPFREELEASLAGTGAVFSGYLHGEDLAALYASSDIFVFPSRTDTFGNVVLEAQASGIPVIVTSEGGPCENVLQNETGFVVDGADASALLDALKRLVADAGLRENMGVRARESMERRSFERAFESSWRLFYGDAPSGSAAA